MIFLGYGILASPYVLTVASLIPLGISMGLVEEYFPRWKKVFKWFALIGFLAIAVTSILGIELGRKAFALYEKFLPVVPEGTKGWGAQGNLDLEQIRGLRK